ncbi:MAG: hypothetical protein RL748_779 [Pseudomonadota bacterium]|jgi:DNA-binding transcriptional LysR family regulator
MDNLLNLRVFCLVAEQKSFVAAATRFALSATMVSKHVQHLERRLGTRLLNRTSRHVSLTEAGTLYYEQTRQMLEQLDEVEAAISKVAVIPRGSLRLSAPVWLANPGFASLLRQFQALYPEVRLDVDLSGRMVNLVEEGFDLVLRGSANPEEGMIARRLADIDFPLVAAPAYLQQAGRLTQIKDLLQHRLLWYSLINLRDVLRMHGWSEQDSAGLTPVLKSQNETLLHLAALDGMGLVFLPTWLVVRDLVAGRLERVLPDMPPTRVPLFAIYPSRTGLSAKVRTFIDFLAQPGRLDSSFACHKPCNSLS